MVICDVNNMAHGFGVPEWLCKQNGGEVIKEHIYLCYTRESDQHLSLNKFHKWHLETDYKQELNAIFGNLNSEKQVPVADICFVCEVSVQKQKI